MTLLELWFDTVRFVVGSVFVQIAPGGSVHCRLHRLGMGAFAVQGGGGRVCLTCYYYFYSEAVLLLLWVCVVCLCECVFPTCSFFGGEEISIFSFIFLQ